MAADLATVEAAFLRADQAGDIEAATALAGEVRRLRITQQPAADPLVQKVQASVPGRVIQGMRDPIDAGAQFLAHAVPEGFTRAIDRPFRAMRESNSPLLQTIGETLFADPTAGATDKRLRETEAQYQAARQATAPRTLGGLVAGQQDTGTDWARFAGNVASPVNAAVAARLPVAALSTGWRMAGTGLGLGALGGLTTPVTEEKEQQDFGTTKSAQVGLGAVTGAVLTPVIGKTLQAVAPMVERAIVRLTGRGEITAARASLETDTILKQALQEIGQTVDDLPKAQYAMLRDQVNTALKAGKKLDPAAIMRKADFEAAGMKGTLGQITRDPMQWAREQNLRGVAGVGEPLTARLSGQDQTLSRQLAAYGKGASERVTAGEKLAASLRSTDESLRGNVTKLYGAARESAGKDLEVPLQGLAQDAAKVIEDFADKVPSAIRNKLDAYGVLAGKNQTKVFTFDEANKLLQSINDHVGADRATNTALGRLREAVKKAMLESGSDDAFAVARAAAAARFKLQDAVPALKAASEGSVAPDAFIRKFVLSGNAAEVKGLAKMLQQTHPEAYQEARAQLGAQLQRAAFGENLAGDKTLAAERLSKALRDIGTEKLSAFFNQAEIEAMRRTARLGAYIHSVPSAAAPNTSNTGAAVANLAVNNFPGVSKTAALAKALVSPIINARAVNRAMAAEIPQQAAKASPEAIRRAQLAAALAGLAGGQAVAPR